MIPVAAPVSATAATVAVSGLSASTAALAASASNVANAQTLGSLAGSGWGPAAIVGSASAGSAGSGSVAQAYQPVTAVNSTAPGGGVATRFASVSPAVQPAYDPQSPYADAQGLVAEPNVDPTQQTVNQIEALSAFKANVAVLKAADQMQQSLLAIA
jgi:flagellar basal-body rod protein FlgC